MAFGGFTSRCTMPRSPMCARPSSSCCVPASTASRSRWLVSAAFSGLPAAASSARLASHGETTAAKSTSHRRCLCASFALSFAASKSPPFG